MKNQSLINFLIFISFLAVGYSVSTAFYQLYEMNLTNYVTLVNSQSSNSIQTLDNGQRSILFVGVDTIDASKNRLKSLWLVTYLPAETTLNLLPIFPSGKNSSSDFEVDLAYEFNLDEKDGYQTLGQEVITLLEENNYWWSGYFIFDQIALINILSLFEDIGDDFKSKSVNLVGNSILELENESQDTYADQMEILQTLCFRLTGVSPDADWSKVISLIPTHILTDLDIHQFLMEWETVFSHDESPTCRFPTLEISRIDH